MPGGRVETIQVGEPAIRKRLRQLVVRLLPHGMKSVIPSFLSGRERRRTGLLLPDSDITDESLLT
jgi:hypothetical protein